MKRKVKKEEAAEDSAHAEEVREDKRPRRTKDGSDEDDEKEHKPILEGDIIGTAAEDGQSNGKKSGRRRKRRAYQEIITQMEFYFGDANLNKSSFMQELLSNGPWVDLNIFLRFNKLASMLTVAFGRPSTDDLWKAFICIKSSLLEVREVEGQRQVKRKIPFRPRPAEDEEACTLYVEKLPATATMESVRSLFEQYGEVVYVSLPRFKFNQHQIKGFAFIEFAHSDTAKKALEAFSPPKEKSGDEEKKTDTLPDIKPEDLCSIKAYQKEQAMEAGDGDEGEKDQPLEEVQPKEEVKESEKEGEKVSEKDDEEEPKPKKKKKIRRNRKPSCPGEGELDLRAMSSLRVMSKRQWKQLRNKYLDLQKRNMGLAKKKFRDMRIKQEQKEPEEIPTHLPELEFVPDTIVKFSLVTPVEDRSVLKKKISHTFLDPVKYVDIATGALEFHVRCSSAEQAKKLAAIDALLGEGTASVVLQDQEEKDYWQKINKDRKERFAKNTNDGRRAENCGGKKRGKDRIASKIEKVITVQNTHKFFADE